MSDVIVRDDTSTSSPAPKQVNHLRRAVIWWIVLSVIGMIAAAFLTPLVLPPAATAVDSFDDYTLVLLTVLAVPVGLFVFVFLGYSLTTFRVKERPTSDGVPVQPTPALQIGWLGVTGILCLFLVIWGLAGYYEETTTAITGDTVVVNVTGQQWMWTFNYPKYAVDSQGQTLLLPVNRPVVFYVTSKDVLHGFSVRALGVRVDANPGQITTTSVVTPTQLGVYDVACVELCGLYHTYMWSRIQVVSQHDFCAWISSQGGSGC